MDEKEMDSIEIKELLFMVKKRWWIVAITAVTAVIAAAIISFTYLENVYQASTTLYAGKLSESSISSLLQELQVGEDVIKDYSEIVKSRLVVEETKKALAQDAKIYLKLAPIAALPYDAFNGKISVGLRNDTHIMEITVTDKDPDVCKLVTNRIAGVFISKVKKITKIDNIEIIDTAVRPDVPSAPNKKKNVMIAFVLGIMAGLGIIFLIEFLDNTIKTQSDVQQHLDLPVIGVVYEIDTKVVEKV